MELVRAHLGKPDFISCVTRSISAAEIKSASAKLIEIIEPKECLALIERVDLRPGNLTVLLDKNALARKLACQPETISQTGSTIEAPFQMGRRGVELKLHLGDPPQEIDRTLVENIEKGRHWLAMIIDGKTFSEISEREGVSTRRVQDVANLALIAPDIIEAIVSGEQPNGLSTAYLIKTRFSAVWSEQRAQFNAL